MFNLKYKPVIQLDPTPEEFEELKRVCTVEQPLSPHVSRRIFFTSRLHRRITSHPLNLSKQQMHEFSQRLEASANGKAFFDYTCSYEGSKWLEFIGYGKDALKAITEQAEWYKNECTKYAEKLGCVPSLEHFTRLDIVDPEKDVVYMPK